VLARVVAMVGLAGLVVGCAAARTRTEGHTVVVPGKGYRVSVPPGWERTETDADLALRPPAAEAGLMAHGTCQGRASQRALSVLARHLRFGFREVQSLDEAPVEMAGLHGLRSRFTARLDGLPVSVGAVTLQGRGCVYDLVVVAPPERLAAVAEDFERFAASFRLTGNGGQ
jgi:hypothetical protein